MIKHAQIIRWISIGAAAELGIVGLAIAMENAGFNAMTAFAATFWGLNWLILTAALIVYDHESRGKGK